MSLLLAINGLSGHVAGTSALPPIAEVRAPMSALAPISSASPPGADLAGGVAEGPFLTRSGPDIALFHRTMHSTFATRSVVISSRAMDP